MRRTHRRDAPGVTRCRKPIVNGRADHATPVGTLGFGARRAAGDQQQQAIATRDRMVKPEIEALICRIEVVSVKVDRALGRDHAA